MTPNKLRERSRMMPTPLHQAIRHTPGERAVHRELKRRPWVLKDLVVSCCNLCYVISHFKLGDEHEVDFVVLHGFSGGWIFISSSWSHRLWRHSTAKVILALV